MVHQDVALIWLNVMHADTEHFRDSMALVHPIHSCNQSNGIEAIIVVNSLLR